MYKDTGGLITRRWFLLSSIHMHLWQSPEFAFPIFSEGGIFDILFLAWEDLPGMVILWMGTIRVSTEEEWKTRTFQEGGGDSPHISSQAPEPCTPAHQALQQYKCKIWNGKDDIKDMRLEIGVTINGVLVLTNIFTYTYMASQALCLCSFRDLLIAL